MSLPVLSVLKSLAPMGIALAESAVFSEHISKPVALSMLLIVTSNVVTVVSIPESPLIGYIWAVSNVIVNILHVLSLRICLSADFSAIEKTLHSNLLAASFMLPFAVAGQEVIPFVYHLMEASLTFQIVFGMSCFLAAAIGASIFWLVQETSGSTLSFAGACNKIPVVILAGILFHTHITPQGWTGVFFGITAGVIFAVAKAREKGKPQPSDPFQSNQKAPSRDRTNPDTKIQVLTDTHAKGNDDEFESDDEEALI